MTDSRARVAAKPSREPAAGPQWLELSSSMSRLHFLLAGLGFGAVIIAIGALIPADSYTAKLLFDHREGAVPPYPFTISCIEWLVFGAGMGEMARHYQRASDERRQLARDLLPEDEGAMLDSRSIPPVARAIKRSASKPYRLQRLLLRTIWQFQSSRSVSQASGVMNATLELCQHELDLQYGISRYIAWLLPTVGFIGTVLGLGRGLAGMVGKQINVADTAAFQKLLSATVNDLSIAFNATFVALVLSAILVCIMQIVQEQEEQALNDAAQYCIDHLINKLYVPQDDR